MRRLLVPALLLLPATAPAAERSVYLGSFDKLRVQGPYQVTVATGTSPAGTISGDRAGIEGVEVRLDGSTLLVRPVPGVAGDRPRAAGEPVRIALATPNLLSATVVGAAQVTLGRMKGDRVDLSVSGTGTLAADGLDTPRLVATVIGSGALRVAGKAAAARLLSNGTGSIDAGKLDAGELVVRLEGAGAIRASARYTAQVNNTGLGQVSVAGHPKCQVAAAAGGPVVCGGEAP